MRGMLFLSNGHGEDAMAARLAVVLMQRLRTLDVSAMPLVGTGSAYPAAGIPVLGCPSAVPSGGFSLRLGMGPRGLCALWGDLRAGLLSIVLAQARELMRARSRVQLGVAVGDLFPVVLAGLFLRRPLVMVATAKSDSIRPHFGVEISLLRRFCRLVFARDEHTARSLREHRVRACYAGNLMMDLVEPEGIDLGFAEGECVVGLLPGSRRDATLNLPLILEVARAMESDVLRAASRGGAEDRRLAFAVSLAGGTDLRGLVSKALAGGWRFAPEGRAGEGGIPASWRGVLGVLERHGTSVKLVSGAFGELMSRSRIVVGMAGTANEQAAGLGVPVVAFPGPGAQFSKRFVEGQKRLLGDALSVMEPAPGSVAREVLRILDHPEIYERMARAGRETMGGPGAALRIAELLEKDFLEAKNAR
ncbi:MAG: hypothetical protein HYY08_00075 [Firmicutes bacterium]|nr:hypothetical protein [Bacillota bacterium]